MAPSTSLPRRSTALSAVKAKSDGGRMARASSAPSMGSNKARGRGTRSVAFDSESVPDDVAAVRTTASVPMRESASAPQGGRLRNSGRRLPGSRPASAQMSPSLSSPELGPIGSLGARAFAQPSGSASARGSGNMRALSSKVQGMAARASQKSKKMDGASALASMMNSRSEEEEKPPPPPRPVRTHQRVGSINIKKNDGQNRMEPTLWEKWSSAVDRTMGAHYQYIVGELSANHQDSLTEERKELDRQLNKDLVPDTDRGDPEPRVKKPAMRTAFTDRAIRMNDGHGVRKAMMPKADPPSDQWAADNAHVDCNCPVCRPFDAEAAGVTSHKVFYNAKPSYEPDTARASPSQVWQGSSKAMKNMSGHISKTMFWDNRRPSAGSPREELNFIKNLGRKAKSPTPTSPGGGGSLLHRSFSDDLGRPAGNSSAVLGSRSQGSDENRSLGRQSWQGSNQDVPKCGMKMVLCPSARDPKPPESIVASRRHHGMFKDHVSESPRVHQRPLFRYADPDQFAVGKCHVGVPPSDAAGCATGLTGNQHYANKHNPVTGQRMIGFETPRPKGNRTSVSNDSRNIATLMDRKWCDEFWATNASKRMANSPRYAEMVLLTQESLAEREKMVDGFRQTNGHMTSPAFLEKINWDQTHRTARTPR